MNVQEEIQVILQAAEYLDDETITRRILAAMGMADQAETVLRRKASEDADRLNASRNPANENADDNSNDNGKDDTE